MSVKGKRRLTSLIEAVIKAKGEIQESYAVTIRSDATAILEALVAELDEAAVLDALRKQGFDPPAYRSTLRALAELARQRREDRTATPDDEAG